jgi:uncharacterized membrane protein
MGVGVLLYLTAWLGGVLLALVVGSALFGAAVALANRTLGPVKKPAGPIGWDWDADEDDEDLVLAAGTAVPEPGVGLGMRVLFLTALAVLGAVLVFASQLPRAFGLRRMDAEVLAVFLVPAWGFFVLTGTAAWLLPTTFRRGALVALYFCLILFAVVVVVYALLAAVFGARW